MIEDVRKYKCDACKKEDSAKPGEALPNWTVGSEVGDLCPTCTRAWTEMKNSFLVRMRKDNGEALYD